MRGLLVASVVLLMAGVSYANPSLLFVKMTFPAGGDTTYRLSASGDSYSDPTGMVEYYQKKGVWTLRSTADSEVVWTKATNPFEIGGGFVVQSNTSKRGAPSVTLTQTVD